MAAMWDDIRAEAAADGFSVAERIADHRERTERDLDDTLAAPDRGNERAMTEAPNEPEPTDPGNDPGVDPPPDEGTRDVVDRAEALDEPERQSSSGHWIASDVP